jgi:hypothetical protein
MPTLRGVMALGMPRHPMLVSRLQVVLWCTLELTRSVFGDMGIIAMFPLVFFLASGILTKDDFKGFGVCVCVCVCF